MSKKWALISASSGWGASNMGTGTGAQELCQSLDPLNLHKQKFENIFFDKSYHIIAHPEGIANPRLPLMDKEGEIRLVNLTDTIAQVYNYTLNSLEQGYSPFVLGGDHSIAVGTWSAIHHFHQRDLGLIWIDAHLDSHTPETSPSQARHGMPLAVLMGQGEESLISIGGPQAKVKPENLVIIGARSFETGEQELLNRLGVRIFYGEEVHHKGFDACLSEAIAQVTRNNQSFGISFDIDAFDPTIAPGTGAAEPDGLWEDEVLTALTNILAHEKLLGFELVEFNPQLDTEHKTLKLIWKLVYSIMGRR